MAAVFVRALLAASAAVLLTATLVPAAKRSGDVVVSHLEGAAEAAPPGEKTAVPLSKNDRVGMNWEVRVGDRSRLELRFPDGTVMRLSEGTRVTLNETAFQRKTGRKSFRVTLAVGKLWAHVKKLATPDSKVEVTTLNAVAGVRGTVYRITVETDGSALIRVYDGQVYVASPPKQVAKPATEVSGPVPIPGPHSVPAPYHEVTLEEWHVIIRTLQQVTISPTGQASTPEAFDAQTDGRDEWVRWNRQRDQAVAF